MLIPPARNGLQFAGTMEKELDNHGIIGLVSADLSKAFDMLPHDLIVLKLWKYGADEKTFDSIKDYRSGRQQRVKLGHGFF